MADDGRLSTREFDAIKPSMAPRDVEAQLRRQAQHVQRVSIVVLLVLVVAVVATLTYTVRTLRIVEQATSPEAQERTAQVVAELVTRVDCANRENLEEAINALIEELTDGRDRARIHLEPAQRCLDPQE